ncbi:MAG TPA: hypothetical protein VN844_15135 [Pyrinomonadaceae bacterium]|nr:hypothetical protein [Pyrinomonadaceae bacterium]
MNKKNDINKKNIIVGITSAAIIAIAIIAVIGIFTVKSHAQVKQNAHDNVALTSLKEFGAKTHKDVYPLAKNQVYHKAEHVWVGANEAKLNWAKVVARKSDKAANNLYDKPTVAVSKDKNWHKNGAQKASKEDVKLALHSGCHQEKGTV